MVSYPLNLGQILQICDIPQLGPCPECTHLEFPCTPHTRRKAVHKLALSNALADNGSFTTSQSVIFIRGQRSLVGYFTVRLRGGGGWQHFIQFTTQKGSEITASSYVVLTFSHTSGALIQLPLGLYWLISYARWCCHTSQVLGTTPIGFSLYWVKIHMHSRGLEWAFSTHYSLCLWPGLFK